MFNEKIEILYRINGYKFAFQKCLNDNFQRGLVKNVKASVILKFNENNEIIFNALNHVLTSSKDLQTKIYQYIIINIPIQLQYF